MNSTGHPGRISAFLIVVLSLTLVGSVGVTSLSKMKANKTHAPVDIVLAASSPTAAPARPEKNPDREAYFGETHLHTGWSLDAWVFGNRITGPDDAYKYAQGETIKHPLGYDIHIETPLDFMGVTDHSEYVGLTKQRPAHIRASCLRLRA